MIQILAPLYNFSFYTHINCVIDPKETNIDYIITVLYLVDWGDFTLVRIY